MTCGLWNFLGTKVLPKAVISRHWMRIWILATRFLPICEIQGSIYKTEFSQVSTHPTTRPYCAIRGIKLKGKSSNYSAAPNSESPPPSHTPDLYYDYYIVFSEETES